MKHYLLSYDNEGRGHLYEQQTKFVRPINEEPFYQYKEFAASQYPYNLVHLNCELPCVLYVRTNINEYQDHYLLNEDTLDFILDLVRVCSPQTVMVDKDIASKMLKGWDYVKEHDPDDHRVLYRVYSKDTDKKSIKSLREFLAGGMSVKFTGPGTAEMSSIENNEFNLEEEIKTLVRKCIDDQSTKKEGLEAELCAKLGPLLYDIIEEFKRDYAIIGHSVICKNTKHGMKINIRLELPESAVRDYGDQE